ncbi:MAG: AAA family ATPase, partial [Planctomycetes bacterium]|nr:AAA family ATPase [Planctomycetota bacterium]
ILDLPDLPAGGDIVDFIAAHDAHDVDEIRAEIVALADAAPAYNPAEEPEEPAADGPAPVLVCVADVPPERLRWLWQDRIPLGKVTLLYGDPGLGKSFVTLDIAARVSRGLPWPDAPGKQTDPGGVVLLSAEDDVGDTIRPRLDVAGAVLRRIGVLKGVRHEGDHGQGYFNLASDMVALDKAVRQTPDARLVIIDPISAYLGGTDSHKNADIRGLLAPLADLAARHSVALVCVTHLNKSAGGRALYRAMGSLGFVAAARAGWLVIADAADPHRRLFLPTKMNNAKEPNGMAYTLESVEVPEIGSIGRVLWESGPVTMTADDALAAAAGDPEERTALDSAAEWLKATLADGAMKSNDVKAAAKESGMTWATVRRARDRAGVKVRRQGFGPDGAWYWFLPGCVAGA